MAVQWGLAAPQFNALETLRTFGASAQQAMQQRELERAEAQRQQQAATRQQAGMQLQAGDTRAARMTATLGGDFDFARVVGEFDDDRRKQLAGELEAIGTLYPTLKGLPAEQRAAAAQPILRQLGLDDDDLSDVDWTDAGLDRYYAFSQAGRQALEAAQKAAQPVEISAGATLFDPISRQPIYQAPALPKWQFDADSGSWLQEPSAGGMGGVPQAPQAGGGDTFARMIQAESGGRQFARGGNTLTSSAGALGIAQIMPATAPEAAQLAGVPYDAQRLRTDPEYNAQLGRAYFEKQLADFGDPALAAAAYNAGPERVRQAIERGGSNWMAFVPAETRAYVAKVARGGGEQQPRPGVVNVRPARRKERDAPSGFRWNGDQLAPIPGGPADPAVKQADRSARPATEAENKATGYLAAAVAAQNTLNTITGYNPSEYAIALDSLANGNPLRRDISQVDRRALNAQLAFAGAALRLESGAVVTDQEIARKARQLFPMPGDGPEVQSDKRTQREAALRAMRVSAGTNAGTVPRVTPNPAERRNRGGGAQVTPTIRRLN